jgi:hypothetical protein
MNLQFATALLAVLFVTPALGDIEKIATTCGQQICFRWWPTLPTIEGWQQDREHSLHYNFNALAPSGSSFATAETVMYANAVYRPRVPDEKTLAQFIDSDTKKFCDDTPGLKIEETTALKTADGNTARSFLLSPTAKGQWERVSYIEEGEYYMVFVASSRTQTGLRNAAVAFEAMVSRYREKP